MVPVDDGGFCTLVFEESAKPFWEKDFGVELEDLAIKGTTSGDAQHDGDVDRAIINKGHPGLVLELDVRFDVILKASVWSE